MPIGTPHGTLDYKQVSKVTFVGASSNTVIDTTTGSLGVGVDSGGPTSNLHVVGNAYVSSNLTVSGNVAVSENLTVSGNVTSNSTVSGNVTVSESLTVSGNGILDAYDKNPICSVHGIIGREPLYTWQGDQSFANAANVRNEPYNYNSDSSWGRIRLYGSSAIEDYYHTNQYMLQYMTRFTTLSQDNDGNLAQPSSYVLLSLPVRWIDNKTCSHMFFIKMLTYDRFEHACVYVTNEDRTNWYRLGVATTNMNQQTFANSGNVSPFPGPHGDTSQSHTRHEWGNCSIPQYVVEEYSYATTEDTNSPHNRNINIAVCGTSDGNNNFYPTGIAMRPNIYGLTFWQARVMYLSMNGGTIVPKHSDNWEGSTMCTISITDNLTNLYVPICPPKNPTSNAYPDFYMGYLGHRDDGRNENRLKFFLHGSDGTYQFLGRQAMCYKGRYGHAYVAQTYDTSPSYVTRASGVYVPSPDPKYIQTIQGRPYLRIRIDGRNTGSDGNHHPRGLYTEVVYPDGSSDGYGPTQNIYNI